jgi:hypothetical protein
MIHIKTILAKVIENASKAKFYHHNRDIFIKYFESIEQYQNLIEAGNFKKMNDIIKEKTDFTFDKVEEVVNNLNK